MSSSISPWLAKAVEDYRNKHRVNLSFEHKGGFVQVVQFTSYRDKRKPDYDQLGVWAYLHDIKHRVLVKFEASAINDFERNHDSFTSYKGGLFQIRAFRFQYTSSYVDRVPSSAQIDLGPKERKMVLSIHSFRYLSSKGESDWSPSARNFDLLAAAWIRDILLDEEEKQGNSISAGSVVHTKPAEDDIVTAVADEAARRKVMRKGGNARQTRNTVYDGRQFSPSQQPATSASISTPTQNGARITALPGTPSPSQNLSPDFISARKLVQQQSVAKQAPAENADDTPTKLPSVQNANKATTANEDMKQSGKRKRSLESHDQFDLDSPEPEEMFTQFSEEAAPISDPPPPSSHASSRSISPESEDGAISPDFTDTLRETQGLSIDTQERIRSLFRPSSALQEKVSEAQRTENASETTKNHTSPLLQDMRVFAPSRPTSGIKKRKKARLPRFELSSQASGDEDETMLQDEEADEVLSAEEGEEGEEEGQAHLADRSEDAQPVTESMDLKLRLETGHISAVSGLDTDLGEDGQTNQPLAGANADMTVTMESIEIAVEGDQAMDVEVGELVDNRLQDAKITFETQSEASEAESVSDEGFEFIKLVPGLPDLTIPQPPIVKQEHVESEEIDTVHSGLAHDRQQGAQSDVTEQATEGDGFQAAQKAILEEEPVSVAGKSQEVDIDSLINSLDDMARDESTAEHDRELQSVRVDPIEGAVHELLEVYRTFARSVQKDWFDRLALSKTAISQSNGKKRRPVYDDDAALEPHNRRPRSGSSGKKAQSTFEGQASTLPPRISDGHAADLSSSKKSRTTTSYLEQPGHLSVAPARRRSKVLSADKVKPRRSSTASSTGQTARLSELVQGQINETQASIKQHIKSVGLSMKDSADLWFCCSGDLEIARKIALHDVAKSQASEGSQDLSILPLAVQNAYKSCWTYEDDQLIEKRSKDADPQHQLDLANIELRRGKGSVEKRRLFLKEDPIAKRLPRKPRYPFNIEQAKI